MLKSYNIIIKINNLWIIVLYGINKAMSVNIIYKGYHIKEARLVPISIVALYI